MGFTKLEYSHSVILGLSLQVCLQDLALDFRLIWKWAWYDALIFVSA